MFSKVQRKKAYVENEEEYFSYFELEGAEKSEPLIFFHATGLNAETYLNLLEKIHLKLDRKKTIIAFDQRGHGITNLQADPKKLTSWDQYADDAEVFLEKINISSAIFFGHSMGSIVAAEVAKRNNLLMWAISQASYDAHDRAFIDYAMLDNSKTGKAGEADVIIGLGKTGSSEVENNVRHICISKNKINGWHGMLNCNIDVEHGIYY